MTRARAIAKIFFISLNPFQLFCVLQVMGVSPRAKRVLRALPLSTPLCYHQMLRTSRVFCYEIVTKCRALSRKRQSRFTDGFRVLPLTSFPGGKTRRVQKPSVFIRSDVHAVRAGINIRGQGFERARWAMKRKALPVRQGGREANATLTDYAELRVCRLYPNRN